MFFFMWFALEYSADCEASVRLFFAIETVCVFNVGCLSFSVLTLFLEPGRTMAVANTFFGLSISAYCGLDLCQT